MTKKKEQLGLFEEEIESVVKGIRLLLYKMADEVIESKINEAQLLTKIKFYEQLIKNQKDENN